MREVLLQASLPIKVRGGTPMTGPQTMDLSIRVLTPTHATLRSTDASYLCHVRRPYNTLIFT